MKQIIRAFAIGLFTAGAVIAAVFYLTDRDHSSEVVKLSHDEMAEELKSEGYRVVTEEEYISLKVNKDKQQKEEADNKAKEKPPVKKESEEKQDVKQQRKKEQKTETKQDKESRTFTIQIVSGMKTAEISEMLADNGIIKDAQKFDDFLEEYDYARKIQIGKHKLSTDMNESEVAKALTK